MRAMSAMSAQFNRTHISERDFAEAEDYLQALNGRRAVPVKRALLFAAIVAYARPFTQNERQPSERATSRPPINVSKRLSADDQLLHQKLLDLRNQALAHSEWARRPVGRVFATSTGFLTSSKPFDILSENIDVKQFKSMCRLLKLCCSAKLFEINRALGPLA